MLNLDKKVAVVTGASKGIGAGIARELAASGAAVVVNYATDGQSAEALVEQIKQENGQAVAVQADVSNAADVVRLFQDVCSTFGRLDILVNNAGVYRETPLSELTETEFHREFNINVLGPLLVIRESLQYFDSQGGTIINIGSGASKMCPPGFSIYSASKSALDAITGVLSKELASCNIRVNSVNPGATLSEGTQAAGLYGSESDFEKQLVAMTPLNRIGTPADIARVVAFLASDDSAWLTGEIIQASGGLR
ncbi:SDR family NAD(P)-dependent oxidoreductase [Gimesia sp.]|uniref:SDR family NAD(P)-dependent oxidoreductase n=1 Tax=Gimesia sp. TaxID=2024833 RepID=UPI003A936971